MKVHDWSKGWIAAGICGLALAACDDTEATTGDGGFELVGAWQSEFGQETITQTRWDGFCQQAVTRFDNAANVAILETVGGQDCGTGFAKVVWKEIVDDAFHYCTAAFGEATADAAANAPTSAVSDDLAAGCGGFPWSHLTRTK